MKKPREWTAPRCDDCGGKIHGLSYRYPREHGGKRRCPSCASKFEASRSLDTHLKRARRGRHEAD